MSSYPGEPSSSSYSVQKRSRDNNGEVEAIKKRVYPPGYRFVPTDEELIFYLDNKLADSRLFRDLIPQVNVYAFSPQQLSEDYEALGEKLGEKIWYFFSPRERKYLNGQRPNRRAGDGYWKATGKEKDIMKNNEIVGFERALVYYVGKPPRGVKSDWIMHEYRINAPPRTKSSPQDMKLDDCVLCKIYIKQQGCNSKKNQKAATTSPEVEEAAIVEVEMAENHALQQQWDLETTTNHNNYLQTVSAQDYHYQDHLFRTRYGMLHEGYIPQQQQQQHGFVNTHTRVFMENPVPPQCMMTRQSYGPINEYNAGPSTNYVSNNGMPSVSSLASLPESSNARLYDYPQMLDMSQAYGGQHRGFGIPNYHQQHFGSRVADTPPAFSPVGQSDFHNVEAQFQHNGGLSNDFNKDAQAGQLPSSEEGKVSSGHNSDGSWVTDFSVPMMGDLLADDSVDDYIVAEDPDNDNVVMK